MSPTSRRLEILLPLTAIILLSALFFHPQLFQGKVVATKDAAVWLPWREYVVPGERPEPSYCPDMATSYYPRRVLLSEMWKSGSLLLWNPYSFCGSPFVADVQVGVFYPVNWPLLFVHPYRQFGLFLFFHFAWGGIGLFLLLRRLGVSPIAACGAGCAFLLSEYFVKRVGMPTFPAAASWVPWLLLLAERILWRPSIGNGLLIGIAAALTFLAGQPQTAIQAGYAVVLFLVVRAVTERSRLPLTGAGIARVGGILALGAVVAALLSAVQLIPTIDLASRSARTLRPYETVISGAFHPADAIRLVVPDFFGSPLAQDSWNWLFRRGDHFFVRAAVSSLSPGTPIFFLAFWGLFSSRVRKRSLAFLLLLVLFAGLSFGTPLARLAYDALPGFKFSRIDRAGFFLVLAFGGMAGLAAHDLGSNRGAGRRIYGVVLLALAGTGLLWVQKTGAAMPRALGADLLDNFTLQDLMPGQVASTVARSREAALFAAGTAVAFFLPAGRIASLLPFLLAVVQLFTIGSIYRGDRDPESVLFSTPAVERLAPLLVEGDQGGGRIIRFGRERAAVYPTSEVLPPSTNVLYDLRDVQGYNALAERTVGDVLESALGQNLFSHGIWAGRRIVAPEDPRSMEHPLLDALSVRVALGGFYGAEGEVAELGAEGWTPVPWEGFRLWKNEEALPRARMIPWGRGLPEEELSRRVARGEFDPRREALWAGSDEWGDSLSAPGEVRVLSETWDEIRMATECKAAGMLVVADTHSPGWCAEVDGQRAEIRKVYGVIRGVQIPEGRHEVRMWYAPPVFRIGFFLTVGGVLLVLLLLLSSLRRQGGT
jgi:hypothetical protein